MANLLYLFGMLLLLSPFTEECIFYSKMGHDSEAEGVRFIRVREDMHVGGEILTLRAYPRDRIKIKGIDRSHDFKYFKLRELNDTYIQIFLEKSIDDLVDRDVPQNLLKFKIECSGRNDETSTLAVTVYIEDINDHYPIFQNAPYMVRIDESTPIGSIVFQGISAFDRDKPNTPNSDVQFSLGPIENIPGGTYFSLESPHRPSVVLRRQLDYDDGIRRFDLAIFASDRGTIPNRSNTTLQIIVEDHDDLPPRFTEGVYRTSINEFYPVTGLPIHVPLDFRPIIRAYDQDSINATLIYDIISGNERNLFSVNPATGMIYLNREIDLEEESLPGNTFVLQLEARQANSPLKRALARVEVEIIDLNDNPPEFEVDVYNISIVENLPSGFSVLQVNAIDRDQGENAEFYYNIEKDSPPGAFVIDPRTGWITVREQELLDREKRTSITMVIQAVEKHEPYNERDSEAGVVQVEITLLDSNDNTPEFEMGNLYEFKINIDSTVGTVVGRVVANDPDEGRNGMILYELQHPRGSGVIPFRLDPNSGTLYVSGTLKRGRIAVFVEASDQPTNPSERRFSLAVVTIEVIAHVDNNDIEFVGAPYEFWVGSDVPLGASVGQIRTNLEFTDDVDDDEVMYDLLHSYVEGVPFAVEEKSGIVTVIRDLADFDRNFYEFEAVATHETLDKSSGQLKRRFSKSEKQITQNGDVFEIDEGIISDSQNVLVTNVTIHIVNSDDEHGIIMRGSHTNPIEFHVKENLANALIGQLLFKNMSRFHSNQEEHQRMRSITNGTVPGTEIFSAKNFRKDRNLNSKYSKNSTNSPINKTTRKNRHTSLDTSFFISVTPTVLFEESPTAAESNPVPAYTSGKFGPKVKETDVMHHISYESKTTYDTRKNDNKPTKFESLHTIKNFNPIQNDPIPTINTKMNIVDDKGQITANLLATDSTPNIETSTLVPLEVIITPRPTSRIPKQTSLFVIRPNSSVTDTSPTETQSSRRSHTTDFKRNSLRFLIANQQDVTDMITITNDGTLMTVKSLDRETRDIYRLTVIAEYNKGFINGAGIYQVTIYVDDDNDNPPLFNHKSYTGIISENSPVGTDVLFNQHMIVKDADIGKNAQFTISIHGKGSQMFTIELVNTSSILSNHNHHQLTQQQKKYFNNYRMMLLDNSKSSSKNSSFYSIRFIGNGAHTLDREREQFYDLKLIAKDTGGLSSEAQLKLIITDVNDNAPMFERITIFKNSGIEVLEFTNDLKIYFSDQSNITSDNIYESTPVSIKNSRNPEPPTIVSNTKFSHPSETSPLIVDRVNVGLPRLINPGRIPFSERRARKLRENKLTYPYFSIFENATVGKNILKITAIDEDIDDNANIFYEITNELIGPQLKRSHDKVDIHYFGIDRLSGDIRIARPLPPETDIQLNISAKDVGGLNDFVVIKFKVLDINNHPPVFDKPWYTFDLNEGNYVNTVVGKITATDEDYGNNANVTYKIQSDKPIPFYITPLTGILKVNGDLDREAIIRYEFQIMASDNSEAHDKLSSYAEIEINILDINDNAPEFVGYDELIYIRTSAQETELAVSRKLSNLELLDVSDNSHESSDYDQQIVPVYKAYLNKNTEPGTFVKEIKAIDRDFAGNGNGLVMYALQHSHLPHFFEIDSREGIIATVSKFTRFQGYEHFNLTVVASDLGIPPRSSTALLLINLQGDDLFEEDENERLFPNKYYEIEVEENSDVPVQLIQVNASHLYQDEQFKWSMMRTDDSDEVENNLDQFQIDQQNGSLWLVKPLDRERRDLYSIKIRADRQLREPRNMRPSIVYPIGESKIHGLRDNELKVVIRVTDVNDHAPKFAGNGKPIIAVIPHMANFGFPVTKVLATDQDIGINAEIRYSLLNEPSNMFGIDPVTGSIRLLGPIRGNTQRVYGFDVKATDRNGTDEGKSAITNVFVYLLDENRQVRVIMAGKPEEVEREIDTLTKLLSEATSFDIRVRMLEPHLVSEGDLLEQATDVYIYAVDPRSNTIVDMDELHSTMSTIAIQNLTLSSQIIDLPELGNISPGIGHHNYRDSHLNPTIGVIKSAELASIILAVVVFAGSLTTALCIVCVRYRRRQYTTPPRTGALAYSISGTPSTIRTLSKSSDSTKQMLPTSRPSTNSHLYDDNQHIIKDWPIERTREYIDVPLPQSVLTSNFNLEHDASCLRYNQINNVPQTLNLDMSVTSLHSSGRDSGLDLSRERTPSKQIVRMMRGEIPIPRGLGRRKKCNCELTEHHSCSGGEESSDSYEDSLKNVKVCRRRSLPKVQGFRRSARMNPVGHRGIRHSFSGVRDDLVMGCRASGLMGTALPHRQSATRTSFSALEERLRTLERSFREPFHLNNDR